MVKTFIGNYYIQRHSTGFGENHTAYQIIDYVGQNHLLVQEIGWSCAKRPAHRGQCRIVHSVNEYTDRSSIVEIEKIIEDFQKNRLSIYSYRKEVEKELSELSIEHYRRSKVEDNDEWIKSLTRENI